MSSQSFFPSFDCSQVQHEKDVRWRLSMPRSNTAHSISLNSPIESGTNARRRSFGDVSESAFEMVASSEPQKMMKQLPSAAGEAAAEPAAQVWVRLTMQFVPVARNLATTPVAVLQPWGGAYV